MTEKLGLLTREETIFKDRMEKQFSSALDTILYKNRQYGGSWKSRGGVGAFMMFARKWDRLETALRVVEDGKETGWKDLFDLAVKDNRSEGIVDDLEDLRNYLALAIDEINVRKAEAADPDTVGT